MTPDGRHILYDVCMQYVLANTRPLGQECNASQLTSAYLLNPPVHDDYRCELLLFRRCRIHSQFLMPS